MSGGINDNRGLVENSSFKSGDIRLNVDQILSPKIKINARLSGFFSETDFAEGGDLIEVPIKVSSEIYFHLDQYSLTE